MGTVIYIFILALICAIPFFIGTHISKQNKQIFKFKNKNYEKITHIMINNYYGNLICSLGIIIDLAIVLDTKEMSFWGISAITIFAFYIKHAKEATGDSLENVILDIIKLNKENRKIMFFFEKTASITLSIIITGAIMTKVISPLLF